MKYIYGPVGSWRLGASLGIDLISGKKECSFDCSYCQLGGFADPDGHALQRKIFIPTKKILKEFDALPKNIHFDYATFSGSGEPTMAQNLGEVAKEIKKRGNYKVAVLTNSTLMDNPIVQEELSVCDLVLAKLDAASKEMFKEINRPCAGLDFQNIVAGIKSFAEKYPGKLALQIMFTKKNLGEGGEIAQLAKTINPSKVFLSTPIRKCAEAPVAEEEMNKIETLFFPLKVYNVFRAKEKFTVAAIDENAVKTRRPEKNEQCSSS